MSLPQRLFQTSRSRFGLLLICLVFFGSARSFSEDNPGSVDGESPAIGSLLVSDGSRFDPKDFYPRFSWDTTPMYYMFGDEQRVLHPEEVEFIAERTDFLCIEKSHGSEELGAAELGAKHEAAAFKKLKPDMKVLFYFNAARAWSFTSYSQNFKPGRIDRHPELKKLILKINRAC